MNPLRRLVASTFRACARVAVRLLPRRVSDRLLRPDHRDYRQAWVNAAGIHYRMDVYRRQHDGGSRPLLDNPTIDEIAAVLRADGVRSVLEAGCGWGRLADGLRTAFDVTGCDISPEMLKLCPDGLKTFRIDLAVEDPTFIRANAGRWDAAFTRGVLLYVNEPEACMYFINNLLAVTRGKVHCWEWPEVCERVRSVYGGERLALHPITHKEE